ncbi:MAG: T9SS type A sorting domain-containing protein [Bacteroidota bacterium]
MQDLYRLQVVLCILLSTASAYGQDSVATVPTDCPFQVVAAITHSSCHNSDDGAIFIDASGGVGGYRYSLDGVDYKTTGLFGNLAPREYQLFVKDANECVANGNVLIDAPPEPQMNIQQQNVSCPGGADASFIVIIETVGGGRSNYEYSIDGEHYQPDSSFNNLPAGPYEVYARNDNHCISQRSIVIEEPDGPVLRIEKEDVSCPGGADASFIVIIETVGGGRYDYSLDGEIYQPDSLFEDLPAGAYALHVRHAGGCVITKTVIIREPREPHINFDVNNVSCPGGADASFIVIIETVGGGRSNYEYSIDGEHYQPDSLFSNFPAGLYTVYVRNDNQCISSAPVEITEPPAPFIDLQRDSLSCAGDSSGSLMVFIDDPDSHEYSLDGIIFQSSNQFLGLDAGNYTLYIRSSIGCWFERNFNIGGPPPLHNVFTDGPASCGYANGWLASTASGGKGPYGYTWGNGHNSPVAADLPGGLHRLTITDSKGCQKKDSFSLQNIPPPTLRSYSTDVSCHGQANGTVSLSIATESPITKIIWSNGANSKKLSGLPAGKYAVTVTDANHCQSSKEITITEPQELKAKGYVEKVGNTGAISLEISGGTQPYFCSWSNGSKAPAINELTSGKYEVTVSDEQQCTSTQTFELQPAERPTGESLRLYPVPTVDDVNIDFDLPEEQMVSIELYDSNGRLLMSMPKTKMQQDRVTINLDELPVATYVARIIIGKEMIIRKIIKQTD